MFLDALRKRRSIRKFEDKKIEKDIIEDFKEALLRAPSSKGLNHWEFIFVENKETLKKLSEAKKHGSSFLKDAVLGVVVLGDDKKAEAWVEDCSISAIFLQVLVAELGLGSCWIQIRGRMHNETTNSEEYIKNILNIPNNLRIETIIAIGYPAENKEGHSKERLDYSKIYFENYGQKNLDKKN